MGPPGGCIGPALFEVGGQKGQGALPGQLGIVPVIVVAGGVGEGMVGIVTVEFQPFARAGHFGLKAIDHGRRDVLIPIRELPEHRTFERGQGFGGGDHPAVIDHGGIHRSRQRRLE